MQTDPIGYEDQLNLYAYVHNDPVNNTDPTGQETRMGQRLDQRVERYESGEITSDEFMDENMLEAEAGFSVAGPP